jgi:hypothetical protein
MAPEEPRRRMLRMREAAAANNVRRWGSELLLALADTAAPGVCCGHVSNALSGQISLIDSIGRNVRCS